MYSSPHFYLRFLFFQRLFCICSFIRLPVSSTSNTTLTTSVIQCISIRSITFYFAIRAGIEPATFSETSFISRFMQPTVLAFTITPPDYFTISSSAFYSPQYGIVSYLAHRQRYGYRSSLIVVKDTSWDVVPMGNVMCTLAVRTGFEPVRTYHPLCGVQYSCG